MRTFFRRTGKTMAWAVLVLFLYLWMWGVNNQIEENDKRNEKTTCQPAQKLADGSFENNCDGLEDYYYDEDF